MGTAVAVVLLVSNAKTSQREQAAVRACEMGAMSASSPTGTASVTAAMSDDASVMGEWPRYRVRGSIEVQDVGGPGRLVDYTCVVIGGEDDGAPGLSYTVRDISVTLR
ncbi:hypothetical protein IFT73_04610 [Aeromicrobium sp. CFBP 8757]|uniref:hypothetical protein n=1 Tax=Aeromicrobium sp. CFBP 8757 TaxID=2775288 RepID=UPI0017841E25|nr:hypothetical protein [Aeromicrobium sp. CFBP 8757]MBD8606128.1 hypothetical protein [Aeromicrobium sp. CFBP 8757]